MREEDIPEFPKLELKISELSPGHLLLPNSSKKANIST